MSDLTNPDNNSQVTSNPATQTLFRFVSLRNPQLAKRDGNKKFIFRDEDLNKGVFDAFFNNNDWASSGKTKIDFLTDKVKTDGFDLTKIYRTEGALKRDFTDLYDLSKILIENESLTSEQIVDLTADAVVVTSLWDSLIYQVLVQEDFYVKEIITQMLQTLHYIDNYNTFSTEVDTKKKKVKEKEISTAKVVLPESLFVDSVPVGINANPYTVGASHVGSSDYISGGETNNNVSGETNNNVTGSTNTAYFPTESDLKRQKVAIASYEKSQLQELKKDLTKAEKIYRKQYAKSYDLALKDYQDLVKPLYEAYDAQLLQVEATFTEEMSEAAKKLALSQVAKPEVPDFEFEFRQERDTAFLQAKLSQDSLTSFAKLIGEYVPAEDMAGISNGNVPQENILEIDHDQFILPEDENLSFGEMLETIDERLSALNEEIYQNTEIEKQEYVSVGGVLIPVNKGVADKTEGVKFLAKTIAVAPNKWSVLITFLDSSISIINANYKTRGISGDINDTYFLQTTNGSYKLFNNQTFLAVGVVDPNAFFVQGTIKLSDGNEYSLGLTMIRNSNVSTSAAEGHYFGDSSLSPYDTNTPNDDPDTPDNPDTPTTPVSTNNSFIPKGFGIKRLGIADYLKVEQSTHAYVEGEVAAIENIMAREYREKSTRRLRRSEVTETSSSDTEREQLTDTTTSSRFEMQSEVAKILQEATDKGINANTSYSYNTGVGGNFSAQLSASYANHRNKEESMRQAITQAQDVTARALDRVVTKVHQERIEKIVEEFEENNSHGFDNRKGDKHVVGVYRWVDKLMKNQVWNYGKRLMFEFAVPQPSKMHTLAMNSREKISEPIDPRESKYLPMPDYTALNTEDVLKHWASVYNVEIGEKPVDNKTLAWSHSFSKLNTESMSENKSENLAIPTGYNATNFNLAFTGRPYISANWGVVIGDKTFTGNGSVDATHNVLPNVSDSLSVSAYFDRYWAGNLNVVIQLQIVNELKQQWQQKTFNAIIQAYEDAMTEYNNQIAEEDAKADNIKGANPMFYRQIEQEVLKHNCIAYLTDDKSKTKNIGTKMYTGDKLIDFKVERTDIDEYTSFAKFMEQAFEWDIMSYNLYPYYWANKTEWGDMYVSENVDPLFRSFLRSGMARVVVTVRPGFEDAVQFYMSTGRLWSGGEVPVIGDPMYLSIVDELKDVKGETQGNPWITRIPTSLTILQAQSIGLEVQHALPFTKEDPMDFENPEEVITESNFVPVDAMMEAEKSKLVENIEINNDYLQLTNSDNPHQVIAQLSLEDLKEALE